MRLLARRPWPLARVHAAHARRRIHTAVRLASAAPPPRPAPHAGWKLYETPLGTIWAPPEDAPAPPSWHTCLHEAGHCVMARVLGRPHGAVDVRGGVDPDGQAWSGRVSGSSLPAPWSAEQELLYTLGGPAAESLARDAPIAAYLAGRDAADTARLASAIAPTDREREFLVAYLCEKARRLVSEAWGGVLALAEALAASDGGVLTYRQCARVLREAGVRRER